MVDRVYPASAKLIMRLFYKEENMQKGQGGGHSRRNAPVKHAHACPLLAQPTWPFSDFSLLWKIRTDSSRHLQIMDNSRTDLQVFFTFPTSGFP